MSTARVRFNPLTRLLCCLLSYTLLLTLPSPPAQTAVAESGPGAHGAGKAGLNTAAVTAQAAPRREGELLVRFGAGVMDRGKDDIASSRGARRKGRLRGDSGVERLELQPGSDAAAVAAQLRSQPGVEFAEPNFLVKHDEVTPNDARFTEQWALRNEGQSGGGVGSDVRALAAWRETTGATSTLIAVVDSGIDFTHPDLVNNRWMNPAEVADDGEDDDRDGYADDVSGWDWVAGTGAVGDVQGHGTSVAGVIAAEGNNRTGVAGVMWRASLMSLRVLDSAGTGDVASAVEAIDYAAAHGAQVVNCSWGTEADSRFLREAIERAGRRGGVVVASAGNSGQDIDARPYYPASYDLPNLITVASSDAFDNLAAFSNRGAARVGVAAPGTDILTTQNGGDYRFVSGTSVSAPLVTGIAGLIKTVRPNATAAAVRSAVVEGARRVDTLTGKVSSGGVADAAGALAALRGNPYGNNGGNGLGNGHGQGNGRPYVPPALRKDNEEGRAKGKKGHTVTPPVAVTGAPAANLPDLNASRKVRTSPEPRPFSAPIRANLMCADCDPAAGGGGDDNYPSDPYFGTARMQPLNDVGDPGEDLGSRNFNWALPLLSLPGRAGHDLSLTLYYNSLVWTKQGSDIQYNADHGTPAPGFQLGLPRLQAQFFNFDLNASAYIMITSSGGRVEMRETTPGVYESADSAYTQLTFPGSVPVVRTKDGTQYIFGTSVGGGAEWRCTQVKDRNGNYISADYHANGHIDKLTDTLGRVVNFVYYADGNLQQITQTWGGSPHVYALFTYKSEPVAPSFAGLNPLGMSGPTQTLLSSVTMAGVMDSYHFDYNSYGQVYQIRHKAPDGHELSHTRYNLSDADLGGAAQTDCPRFTARFDKAQEWNNNQEAVTTFSVAENATWQNPETSQQETGTRSQQTFPDGTTVKVYSHSSGWDAGMPRLEEIWATEIVGQVPTQVLKKWTGYTWAQDNLMLTFPENPRLAEINVYDGVNQSRTTLEYNAGFGLPTAVRQWGKVNGQMVLFKRTTTEYHLGAAYLNSRVIGLPWRVQVYDGAGALVSKNCYYYDGGGGWYLEDIPGVTIPQHDPAYNTSYTTGRGNLILTQRFDVGDPDSQNNTHVEFKQRYNKTGSLVGTMDQGSHQILYSYADSFSDGVSRNTYAYPTAVTDTVGISSTTQYKYDFGAVTRTHKPSSGTGNSITYVDVAFTYDSLGRPERAERFVGQTAHGYKRFVYEPNFNYVHIYETLTGTTQADEFHSWVVLDGAGRARASAADHPGSSAGFSGRHVVYDALGRVTNSSNPTEMDGDWNPRGDDLLNTAQNTGGWRYTLQSYDWQGRPRVTTNTDGTTREQVYGGCGCAGGQVTTTTDEHGRRKRYTKDPLGRLAKVEELNWNTTVYSTTQYAYNARDQLTEVNQQGQLRTFDYDGHGRLWHKTTPEQGTTTYAYGMDDLVSVVTDARGATATYGYSPRHEVESVTYGAPQGSGVAATPGVTFMYDAAGNRFWMTDGEGTTFSHYDVLGRMDWEERNISGVGYYKLSYEYNTAGELTRINYPWQFGGVEVTYGYDKAGRLNSVGGTGVSSYANSITYRASGAVKGMNFGDTKSLSTAYDNRLRPTKWDVSGVLGYKYYYDDFGEGTGRVTFAQHITPSTAGLDRAQTASSLDRSYEYDHLGRLVVSHAGAEARAHAFSGQWGTMDGAYSQGYEYDRWGNMTHRYGWGGEVQGGGAGQPSDIFYTYATDSNGVVNNRRSDHGFTYDASGNLTWDGGQHFAYNAAGNQVSAHWTNLQQGYDGDGRRVRRTENGTYPARYLRSSVLGGQVIAELGQVGGNWQWQRGYVYAGGSLLAVQQGGVYFVHEDPVTKSKRVTNTSGAVQSAVELDPYGADTPQSANSAFQPRKFTSYERDQNGTDEAMFRRYNRWHSRFDQPDPYDGSYNSADPQSLNRYSYTQNDPVNFTDPTGLEMCFARFEVYTIIYGDGRPDQDVWNYLGINCYLSNDNYAPPSPVGPNPGGGQQVTPPGTINDLRNLIYDNKELLAKINSCLRQLMKKNFSKVGVQTRANAPKIDARLTSEQLKAKYTGAPTYAAGVGHVGGKYGTIFIGKEWFNSALEWQVNPRGDQTGITRVALVNAYVHELGNLASYRASGGTTYSMFGVKGATDEDSGYALQACVFNESINMKKP